jgi:hypothetical protein
MENGTAPISTDNSIDARDAVYELRKVADLQPWDENPRNIDDVDFERLKDHIKRLGVYKPLLVNQSNIVLGGNMRLRALRDLGIDEVMCSVVLTDNKQQMIEYALSDNESMGTTDEQKLAELITITPIKQEIFTVQMAKPKPIKNVLNAVGPGPDVAERGGCRHCPEHCPEREENE